MSVQNESADAVEAGDRFLEEKAGAVEAENLDNDGNRLAPAQAMSEEEFLEAEKRLKRKLDIRLLFAVWMIFVMNYLDRNNMAAAKVAGISTTLHLDSTLCA